MYGQRTTRELKQHCERHHTCLQCADAPDSSGHGDIHFHTIHNRYPFQKKKTLLSSSIIQSNIYKLRNAAATFSRNEYLIRICWDPPRRMSYSARLYMKVIYSWIHPSYSSREGHIHVQMLGWSAVVIIIEARAGRRWCAVKAGNKPCQRLHT